MADRYTDAADNEITSRVRNEWIHATSVSFGIADGMTQYVCECSYGGCTSTMALSCDEYEAIRQDGIRFAIAINHEDPETEHVVAGCGRFAVVEKWLGEPRRIANDTNPRRPPLAPPIEPPEADDFSSPGVDRQ